jgi:hypothetical protein
MKRRKSILVAVAMTLAFSAAQSATKNAAAHGPLTENVVLIVSDGLRWQEVFTGAEAALLDQKTGGSWSSEAELRKKYWRDDPAERRKLLMPFLWTAFAQKGQVYGNQTKGSVAHVSNDKWFSYPGYNEMTVGFPNPQIDSNEFGPNPNSTVFEWLNHAADFQGRVAVFGTWDAYERIFNAPRSKLVFQTGWNPPRKTGDASRDALLSQMFTTTTHFDEEDLPNSLLQPPLLDYVKSKHPRVLFVGYGETDNWAHQGRYDLVLDSAHRTDRFVQELWETMQSMPQYRGKTTFIFTCDHGRGSGPEQWKEHGVDEKGSNNIWIAVMGPDTKGLGERHDTAPVVQAQIAATVAALLGRDYRHDVPAAAAPLSEVLPASKP